MRPADFLERWKDSFVCVPISDTWIQHDIESHEKEQRRNQSHKHELALPSGQSATLRC